ncbi:Bug family tripartite tricarboxylate transporter substrate binding protein [Hydrogenophaga atypica]|uniref:Bug family tripartite tricarboxylate transporter substrate binding protein n=1 Tax=Hydrogenophaga atypica TaxID=249409 RepID=A0ABW2QJV3_9BURK
MKNSLITRRKLLVGATSVAAVASFSPAYSQAAYPSKVITLVVAYPAGGDTDVIARLIADKLTTRLGRPVVVENRTGAAGMIGTAYVAKAAPDGHTLLLAPDTFVISPLVMKAGPSTQYDPVQDLTPIIGIGPVSLFMVASASAGVTNAQDVVNAVKAGKIKAYASPGYGSPMHILAELFDKSADIKIEQVAYKGSMPAVADMVGGHIPLMYSTLGPIRNFIKSGQVVPLAVADAQRSPFLPQVPTLAESGYKGAEVAGWQALLGPKGMPTELVKLLNQHTNEILKMPDVVARMETLAMKPTGGESSVLSQRIASDYERYGKIVKDFNIRAE